MPRDENSSTVGFHEQTIQSGGDRRFRGRDRRKWISARDGARVVTTCARARRTRTPRVSPRHAHPASPPSCVRRWHGRRLARHGPASVFASTARRSARRLTAAALSPTAPPPGPRTPRAPPASTLCLRRARAPSPGPRGRARPARPARPRVRAVADPAVPEPLAREPAAAAADDDAAPRAGAVHSVEGSLAILEGISGDVKPARCWTSAAPAPRPCSWRTANRRRSRSCIPARTARAGRAASARRGVFERQTR